MVAWRWTGSAGDKQFHFINMAGLQMEILALRSRYMDMAAILQHLMEEVFRGYIRSHLLYLVQAQMASIIHMIVVRLRKREVIDLIQLSGQQTSLILHVPFQRYSRLVQTNIC